jgi:hypothetical protein
VQQVVLGQEAREEQPVPVLVGGGLREVIDGLGTGALIQAIAQGTPAGAQAVTELSLVQAHVTPVLALVDGEVLQRRAGCILRCLAGLQGNVGQELALVLGQGDGHGGVLAGAVVCLFARQQAAGVLEE